MSPWALQVTCLSPLDFCSHIFLFHSLNPSRKCRCRTSSNLFSGSYLPLFNQIPKSWTLPSLDWLFKCPILHPVNILSQVSWNRFGFSKEGPKRCFLHIVMRKMDPGCIFPTSGNKLMTENQDKMQTAPP